MGDVGSTHYGAPTQASGWVAIFGKFDDDFEFDVLSVVCWVTRTDGNGSKVVGLVPGFNRVDDGLFDAEIGAVQAFGTGWDFYVYAHISEIEGIKAAYAKLSESGGKPSDSDNKLVRLFGRLRQQARMGMSYREYIEQESREQ